MPELPEVETTRRGIEPYLVGQRVSRVLVRDRRLRWPIPEDLDVRLSGQRIQAVERRAKYLLIKAESGTLIVHLGMSGSLRLVDAALPAAKHEHVDILLESGQALRYTDPRRFGAMLWSHEPLAHVLLASLGPEPLGEDFDGDRLYRLSRGRSMAVKPFIMDNAVVVGVGNIYASEAPVRRRDRSAAAGREHLASALPETGRGNPADTGDGHRAWRHDVARFRRRRWQARLFSAGAVRLRAGRRILQELRRHAA